MADVKKALELADDAAKELDEHWYNISLEFLASALEGICTALREK